MGKVIIIKGADFSNVAVESIDIDGLTRLTSNNYLLKKTGYFNGSTWQPKAGVYSIFWPIREGNALYLYGNDIPESGIAKVFRFCTIDGTVTPVYIKGVKLATGNNKAVAIAEQDCYVCCVIQDGETVNSMPDAFIAKDIDAIDMDITPNGYAVNIRGYIKGTGKWGGSAGNQVNTLVYPVVKDEKITIITKEDASTLISILEYGIINNDGDCTIPVDRVPGSSNQYLDGLTVNGVDVGHVERVVLQENTTSEIIIPKDGYLTIYSYDNTVTPADRWPESIVVSFD